MLAALTDALARLKDRMREEVSQATGGLDCPRACSGCEAGAEVNALERLIGNLARLPGLGRKSASRIAYHLLRADESLTRALAEDLATLHQTIRNCSVCGTYTDVDPCGICTDASRDRTSICVVEEPRDVLTIEGIREHRGLYHVLGGAISPIDGVGPGNLRIAGLVERVQERGRARGHRRHQSHCRGGDHGAVPREGPRRTPG